MFTCQVDPSDPGGVHGPRPCGGRRCCPPGVHSHQNRAAGIGVDQCHAEEPEEGQQGAPGNGMTEAGEEN